jgi:hypothetical protein
VNDTELTGSPVGVLGASAAEWWSTYEGLMAEHARQANEADRTWSELERELALSPERSEQAWSAYSVAARRAEVCWDEAAAAYAAWKAADGRE